MAAITLENIVKKYDDGFQAVNDVSIDIADGEFIILVGPSGCGKSTLLRMIVGLEDITSGDLSIGGKRMNDKAPRDRNLSMVFQNYALYPHLSVFENIAFPLRLQKGKFSEEEIGRRVHEASQTLELNEHLDRKPANLSGGQRQRVAMGRAIVRQADAFLFDEPLSNLDAKLRGQMRTEIARMQRRLGTTTVYVTHDQTEAMTLGDRVVVLRKGIVQQLASPRELYEQPANLFVAGFMGSPPMNFLPGKVKGDHLELPFGDIAMTDRQRERVGGKSLVIVGIRPGAFEDARLLDADKRGKGATFRATVDVTEWLGNEQYAYIPFEAPPEVTSQLQELERELDSEQMRTQMVVVLDAASRVRDGEEAELWFDPAKAHIFDPESGVNLTRDEEVSAQIAKDERANREHELAKAQGRLDKDEAPAGGTSRDPAPRDGAVDVRTGRSTGSHSIDKA